MIQEAGIDLVAGLELGNAVAERLHLPGNVAAEDSVLRSQQTEWRAKKGLARIERQSAGFTDIPSTFTRTSSAFGAGIPTSAIRSVSGGPYFSHMNAFITGASCSAGVGSV